MIASKSASVRGLRINYLDYGEDGKPWLVCIHGLSANAHAFDQLGPFLAERHHAISVDLRGHGDSDWGPPSDYTLLNYLGDVRSLLAHLAINRVSIIGSSLGGFIAMILAATEPSLVSRLVLNDVGPEVNFEGSQNPVTRKDPAAVEFADLGEAIEAYRESYPPAANLGESAISAFVEKSLITTPSGRLRWKTDPAVYAAANGGSSAQGPSLWDLYAGITAEVMVVRGAQSDFLSHETILKMTTASPPARAVEVPGVGHNPWLTEPESLAALRTFLS